jgi:hypothetical protein
MRVCQVRLRPHALVAQGLAQLKASRMMRVPRKLKASYTSSLRPCTAEGLTNDACAKKASDGSVLSWVRYVKKASPLQYVNIRQLTSAYVIIRQHTYGSVLSWVRYISHTHTHTHTHMCVCVCVCVSISINLSIYLYLSIYLSIDLSIIDIYILIIY